MNQVTVDIIIFAGIALFLFFKLRSVLGEVDQSDKDKAKTKTQIKPIDKTSKKSEPNERLARLNPQTGPEEWPTVLPNFNLVTDATAHNALLQVHTTFPQLNPYHFLQGAERAFRLVIEAFSKGDKIALKKLLSAELYDAYTNVIDERVKNGEVWESEITDFTKTAISNAVVQGDKAIITVDFEVLEKVTARDKGGHFINDQKGDVEKTQNRWEFSKDMKSNSPAWTLISAQPIGE